MIVKSTLESLGIKYTAVELGQVILAEEPSEKSLALLKAALLKFDLELMDNKKSIIIEKIKSIVIEMVHYSNEQPKINFSIYLSDKMQYEYNYLSTIFSEFCGITIERFIIMHRIERVKELMVYEELTLKEIAAILHYSSIAHLSNQFKKNTGLTPSDFKKMQHKSFISLEEL